jgi:hypothetical protein
VKSSVFQLTKPVVEETSTRRPARVTLTVGAMMSQWVNPSTVREEWNGFARSAATSFNP